MIAQLMKEHNTNDQIPSSLLDSLQRVLPLADKVSNEILSEETDILGDTLPRMFEAMQRIAKFLCDYVKHGRFSRRSLFWIPKILMIAEGTGAALIYSEDKEMLEKMDKELAKVIEDFLRAVDVEALRLASRNGKHSWSQYSASPFSVDLCRASRARASAQPACT